MVGVGPETRCTPCYQFHSLIKSKVIRDFFAFLFSLWCRFQRRQYASTLFRSGYASTDSISFLFLWFLLTTPKIRYALASVSVFFCLFSLYVVNLPTTVLVKLAGERVKIALGLRLEQTPLGICPLQILLENIIFLVWSSLASKRLAVRHTQTLIRNCCLG